MQAEEVATRRVLVSIGLLVLAAVCSTIAGILAGFSVVMLWFQNTRGDGLAAFEIAFLSVGLFTAMVASSVLFSRGSKARSLIAIAPLLWIALAVLATRSVCKDSFITWQNWRWILQSGDQRLYELDWILRGWMAIFAALLLGVLVSAFVIKRAQPGTRDDQMLTTNN